METMETMETSTSSELVEEMPDGDKTETLMETSPTTGPHPRRDEPTPIRKKSAKEDPELQKFKVNVRSRSKNTCRLCGRHFEVPLTICYPGGYICEPCRRDGPPSEPAKIDSQSTLEAGQ